MTDEHHADRHSFLRTGAIAGTALVAGATDAFAEEDGSHGPTKGDVAILQFLSAVEQIESDLWLQYAELGGVQDSELPGLTGGSKPYTDALNNLDADMAQYIHDNTEDEFSHHAFINAYLQFIGAKPVDLSKFATLPSSKATGANQIGRLTNLMQLTIDTSWWTRYRSREKNPDLDPSFVFPQAVPTLNTGQHPAIPRADNDLSPKDHIQAIANTAAFHFASIEQGGSSLYPTLALKVTDPVVLRILLSIGPTETSHFQTNLIMPEPCPFLSRKFPPVSIIRPVSISTKIFGAQQAVAGLKASGLFIGQSKEFFKVVGDLAEDADEATRKCHRDD